MEQIKQKVKTLCNSVNKCIADLIYILTIAILVLSTLLEIGNIFPSTLLVAIFTGMMLAAKFYVKTKPYKYLLALLSYATYIFIVDLYSLPYPFEIVINRWSFLVICYLLLLDNFMFPLLAGLYPAARILMLLPLARAGSYPLGQIYGTANGQICFTIMVIIVYQLFGKLLVERNKYRTMSITDSLTGVSNFAHTIETAKKMLQSGGISVLITDMDRFKQINDTYGHVAGNKVLVEVSEFIKRETAGLERVIGRLGGDEFIIVVRNDGSERVMKLGERLLKAIREKMFVIDPELDPISLSFSVGQANSSSSDLDVEKLLYRADINMYYNKYKNHRLNIFINKQKPILSKDGYEMLNVLAEKDMYTYVHSGYTAQYAAALAKELGLPDETVDNLYTAGWLHDIGKILISSDIVRKSGTLTDEEYSMIKNHVDYGLNVLKALNLPDETINCIQYHHEFWDGSGYPKRLSGENIPYEARILQIADSYSAMIIKRVYRKTFTPEEALKEINKSSGKQFDPKLVEVFDNLIRRKLGVA
ncbi:MAG: bifunctional diguanylate cyclase/phosphohydrolase [Bacillota bacterium]